MANRYRPAGLNFPEQLATAPPVPQGYLSKPQFGQVITPEEYNSILELLSDESAIPYSLACSINSEVASSSSKKLKKLSLCLCFSSSLLRSMLIHI